MENSKPRITVLMSVYNGRGHLREAIESILTQTFKDFEFLIIDDASTDNSREIIKKYPVKLIINEKNLGLTKSLNKGLKQAQGKYIARMDADDIASPYRLEKQFYFMEEHKDIVLCGSLGWIINEKGEVIGKKNVETENIKKKLLFNNQFIHSSLFFKKELGFYNESFERAQDYEFVLRIASKYKVANLKEKLISWRKSENSLSFSSKKQQKCALKARWWAITKYNYPALKGLFHIVLRALCLVIPNKLSFFKKKKKGFQENG